MRNLGATCYLNSLLQQFFFIIPFRYGILTCAADQVSTSKEESLIYELQVLFTNLLLSERQDFDPSLLCEIIKDYDGTSIRPEEQQDVDEFFNLFSDKFETLLKCVPERFLLQDIFGGKICHVVTCQGCKHVTERNKYFLSLSLDMKEKAI